MLVRFREGSSAWGFGVVLGGWDHRHRQWLGSPCINDQLEGVPQTYLGRKLRMVTNHFLFGKILQVWLVCHEGACKLASFSALVFCGAFV